MESACGNSRDRDGRPRVGHKLHNGAPRSAVDLSPEVEPEGSLVCPGTRSGAWSELQSAFVGSIPGRNDTPGILVQHPGPPAFVGEQDVFPAKGEMRLSRFSGVLGPARSRFRIVRPSWSVFPQMMIAVRRSRSATRKRRASDVGSRISPWRPIRLSLAHCGSLRRPKRFRRGATAARSASSGPSREPGSRIPRHWTDGISGAGSVRVSSSPSRCRRTSDVARRTSSEPLVRLAREAVMLRTGKPPYPSPMTFSNAPDTGRGHRRDEPGMRRNRRQR